METFLRVRAFCLVHFAMAGPASFIRLRMVELDSIINRLESYTAAQAASRSAARQGTVGKTAALSKLMRGFEAISRTARPMAADDPNLLQQFRVPHGQSVQGVLAVATSVAGAARQLQAEFVLRGLPDSFVEEFEADAAALRDAVARNIENRRAQVTATAAIVELCGRGMRVLRELDAYVRNTFNSVPETLAAWLSASRVERRAPRPRAGEQTAPPTSPTPDTPAPPPAG
jgi:predicted metal-dependent hydrolase